MEAARSFPRAFPYPPVGRPPLGRSPKAPSFSLHRSSIVVGSVGLTLRRRSLMGLRNSKDAQHSEPSKVVEGETLVQLGQQTLEAIHRFTKSIPEKGVSWLDVGSYKGNVLNNFFWLEVSTLAERNIKKLLVEYDPTRQTFKVLTGGTDLLRASFKPLDVLGL